MAKTAKPRQRRQPRPRRQNSPEQPQQPANQPLNEKPSLSERVRAAFGSSSKSSPPENQAADSSSDSSATTTATSELPAEVEKQLAQVPDVVSDAPEPSAGASGNDATSGALSPDDIESDGQSHIDALLALGYFETSDGEELIAELFDFLAVKFESDHWKLNDARRERLGRKLAACLNSLADKVFEKLPESIGSSARENTEYLSLGLGLAGPVLIGTMKQVRVSRARRNGEQGGGATQAAAGSPAQPQPAPAKQKDSGTRSIHTLPNVPVSTKTLG